MADDDAKLPVPVPRENLIVLRDRREAVITRLTEAFAEELFDVEEFDRRIDLAHRATAVAVLDDLVVDVTAPATTTALVPHAAEAIERADRPPRKRMLAIFGGWNKAGRWTVPRKLRVVCVFGGGTLDFRDADFGPGVTELHITAVFGGLEIIVPPHLAVDCDASAILGGFEEVSRGHTPDPGRALLRITGLAMFGGVSIETRLPGESSRQAKKRARAERKALAGGRAALPPGRDD